MSKGGYETSGPPWFYSYFSLNSWMLSTTVMPFQAQKCLKTTQLLREKKTTQLLNSILSVFPMNGIIIQLYYATLYSTLCNTATASCDTFFTFFIFC